MKLLLARLYEWAEWYKVELFVGGIIGLAIYFIAA